MNTRLILFAAILIIAPNLLIAQTTLTPSERPIRMAIIGDRTGNHQEGIFPKVIAEIARLRPDIALSVGDLIEGYTNDSTTLNKKWLEIKDLLSPLECPIYVTPGNHDITFDPMQPFFEKYIGQPYFSTDYGALHIVILDNSRADVIAEFPAEQIQWVKDDLASAQDAKWTVVFMHKPLWYRTVADNQPDTLHNLFKAYGVDAVFTGHHHRYYSGKYDEILYTSFGSSGGKAEDTPPGMQYHYGWVTFDESGIHIAPIKLSSVVSWDIQTTEEVRSMYVVENNAVSYIEPIPVNRNLTINNQEFTIKFANMLPDQPASGVVEWELPEGWTITPNQLPFDLKPDTSVLMKFTANSVGSLYPLPKLQFTLPYAIDKNRKLSKNIECSRQLKAAKATTPPNIDGIIDESFWTGPIDKLFSPEETASVCDSTAVFFAYDQDNLYVAAYCTENEIEKLAATFIEHDDPIYGEDCFGFMILPPNKDRSGYQIYTNPLGTIYDQRLNRGTDGYYSGDNSWSGSYEVKTSRGDNYWAMEILVPLDQFGAQPASGDVWRVTFRRKQARMASSAALHVPWSYNPASFGQLVFE